MSNIAGRRALGPQGHFRRAIRLYLKGKDKEAMASVNAALEIDAADPQSLVLAGDICLFRAESLGLSQAAGDARAAELYQQAIAIEPNDASAWSGISLVFLYTGRPAEALEAAERGLAVAPSRAGYRMRSPTTYENVVAGLYDHRVRALLELGERDAARRTLLQGLALYPDNTFLSRLFRCFGN